MQNTKYCNDFFELGQQKINISFLELRLPDDDPDYTLKKVMDDLHYQFVRRLEKKSQKTMKTQLNKSAD